MSHYVAAGKSITTRLGIRSAESKTAEISADMLGPDGDEHKELREENFQKLIDGGYVIKADKNPYEGKQVAAAPPPPSVESKGGKKSSRKGQRAAGDSTSGGAQPQEGERPTPGSGARRARE